MVRLTVLTRKKKVIIPKELVYEKIEGKPVYYKDYEKVLSKEKTLEEVMGSSDLHAFLLAYLTSYLITTLDKNRYIVFSGEAGIKTSKSTEYNLDIAIFDKKSVKQITGKIFKTPPKLVIEIDTKAELKRFSNPASYFIKKIQDLLDFGVDKVVWVFTKEKKVWIAPKNENWIIIDWDKDFEITDKTQLNIKKLIEEVGIQLKLEI